MADFLLFEQEGPLVTLTMNLPDKHNPLTGNSAVAEFLAAIDRIQDDPGVRCVILTGAGPSFSAGGNIKDMKRQSLPESTEMALRHEYRRGLQQLTLGLYNLEVPTIAAVNGNAIGLGLDVACMCDLRIASERARFAESFVKLGIIPGDGGAWLLPRVIGVSRAAELAFTADTIDAQQALAWNLVSRVVPHEQLMPTARELAGRITQHAAHGLRLTKRLLREGQRSSLESVLELSAVFQAVCHKTADHAEAVQAFLDKRAPRFS
jgi:enoyl-CoA hydratase/carnithine racemase